MILKPRANTGTIHVTVGMSIDEDVPRRNRGGAIVGLDGRNNTEDKDANGVPDLFESATIVNSGSAPARGRHSV